MTSALTIVVAVVGSRRVAIAQDPQSITGHVSAGNQPVQGASVRIRELGIGTTTNADGRYTFIVRSSSVRGQTVTLEARHVRYNPQSISITLTGGTVERDFELFPVGDSRSSSVASSTSNTAASAAEPRIASSLVRPTLDSTAFDELPGAIDVVSAMAGRVAGLDVTSASTLGGSAVAILRGYHSVLGNTQPLFVVDGVPLENTNFVTAGQPFGSGGFDYGSPIQSLEPSEIATMQVVRGPAAAIWGGRAANGVVLITTKGGRGLTGFEVSASQNVSSEAPLRMPSLQNTYGQGLNGQFSFFDGAGGGTNDGVAANWGPAMAGQAVTQASLTVPRVGDVRPWLSRPDNVSDFFNGGTTLATAAAAQQAGEHEDYRLSLDRRSTTGIIPTNSLTRQSAALRGDADVGSALTLAAHAQVSNDVARDRPASGSDPSNTIGDFASMGRQVDVSALRDHVVTSDPFNPAQISWNYAGLNNPYFALQDNHNRDDRTRWTGGGSATYAFNPRLSAVARIGTDHYDQSRDFDIAPTWMGGFAFDGGRGNFSNGGFQRQQIAATETNVDLLLSGDFGAGRTSDTHATPWFLQWTGGVSHRANSFSAATSGSDQHPDTGTAAVPSLGTLSSNSTTNAVYAVADWSNEVTSLTVSGRSEWYSVLASGSNSAFYPSVVGRLDLARAAGIKSDNFDAAVIHAGWSRNGGEVSPFVLTNVFVPAADSAATVSASSNLSPEITTSLELGGSLSFLRNRASIDLTLYSDQTTGVILGAATGTSLLVSNLGTLTNKGVEVEATLVPVRTAGGAQWTFDARLAKNSNELSDLSNGATAIPLGPSIYGLTVEARTGYALGALVGSGFKRAASGALLLQNGLPMSDGQQRVLGTMAPDWSGGVSSNIHLGWIDVSALVDARMGGSIFSTTNLVGQTTGTFAETALRPDSGQVFPGVDVATGSANKVKATTQAYYQALAPIQEAWVYDASFVKLRDLRVSFSWPLRAISALSGQSARVSLIGRNLAMWSKAPNIDPETALSTTSFQGVELGQPPTVRSIGVQFSLTP